MKIPEVIGTNVLKSQERQIDQEDKRIKAKRADLSIEKAKATIARAQKRKHDVLQPDYSSCSRKS